MSSAPSTDPTVSPLTIRKSVTTLAIAPQTEALTRTARMAYNLMIFIAQNMREDDDGGYTAPMSEIVKGYGGTTRDSGRVRGYIEQMCSTLVRWFPLSRSDEEQANTQVTIEGLPDPPEAAECRVFSLLSEARFTRRSGEQWLTWYFPPTIRETVVHPVRWAQVDIQEMSQLSHYASVALFEICSRYKDVPGGLTNRAAPAFWVRALRGEPEERSKVREWRKFKNESLKPALAEINQKTSLTVELVEVLRGKTTVEVQFSVRRKPSVKVVAPIDLSLVELAESLGLRERQLDRLVEDYSEQKVRKALEAMVARNRSMPGSPIRLPFGYLQKALRNETLESPLLDEPAAEAQPAPRKPPRPHNHQEQERQDQWMSDRRAQLTSALDNLSVDELESFAASARSTLAEKGLLTLAMQRRFDQKQYRAPMIWEYIRTAYAEATFGPDWRAAPPVSVTEQTI